MSNAAEVTPELLAGMPLPRPDDGASKNERGHVLVLGGNAELAGAVLLAGVAALRAGAGRLRLATVERVAPQLGVAVPEARAIGLPEGEDGAIAASSVARLLPLCDAADALLIGPGMAHPGETERLTTGILRELGERPALVLDAGALACARVEPELVRRRRDRTVLTPHAGEMARMLEVSRETVARDAPGLARRAADRLHAVVALKGAETWIAAPGGALHLHRAGCVGLATSGSGDALAGLVAGLLARGAPPLAATLWAVWLHGAAGRALSRRFGPVGFLARELLDEIPRLMNGLAAE
jgi:ADP-dependent NAD(P)H-hydrate dehydratase